MKVGKVDHWELGFRSRPTPANVRSRIIPSGLLNQLIDLVAQYLGVWKLSASMVFARNPMRLKVVLDEVFPTVAVIDVAATMRLNLISNPKQVHRNVCWFRLIAVVGVHVSLTWLP